MPQNRQRGRLNYCGENTRRKHELLEGWQNSKDALPHVTICCGAQQRRLVIGYWYNSERDVGEASEKVAIKDMKAINNIISGGVRL